MNLFRDFPIEKNKTLRYSDKRKKREREKYLTI